MKDITPTGRQSNQEPEIQTIKFEGKMHGKSTNLIIIDEFHENELVNNYSEIEKRILAFEQGHDVLLDEPTRKGIEDHMILDQPNFITSNGHVIDYKTTIKNMRGHAKTDLQLDVYKYLIAPFDNFGEYQHYREPAPRTKGEAKDRQAILDRRAKNKANRKRGRHK